MKPRTLTALTTCFAFAAAMLWPYLARAQQPAPSGGTATAPAGDDALNQAKTHFEAGKNAYNAGDWQTAIREFKAAEALRPSPILDYNIGLANEKLGKRRVAVKYYKRYLELQPNAANKAEVEGKVQQLEADIANSPPPVAQPGGAAQQGAQTETAADMPPADPNAQPGAAAQPGYDPYASTAPPGQPVAAKPAKKKSYWWIGLIIGGAVTITVVIAVVIWLYAVDTTTYYYAKGLNSQTAGSGPNGIDRHDLGGVTLLRF
jgi:tetratricopeptide (TPR) repeat protein